MTDQDPVIVSTLICHRDVELGATCLGSLARQSADPVAFRVHDDGSLTDEDCQRLFRALPVHSFVRRKEADRIVKQELTAYPFCAQFRRRSILGLKLFDVPLMTPELDITYCDSDIYFLRPFRGLFEYPDPDAGCVFMRDYQNAYVFRPWHLALQWRFNLPERLNSGVFIFRKGCYDLDFLEWLFSRYRRLFATPHFWTEQTCWAVLAAGCGGRFWSERQLCVARDGLPNLHDLVAAHLVTPARGLLPKLVARPGMAERDPELLLTEPMPRLGTLGLALDLAGRLARRIQHQPS